MDLKTAKRYADKIAEWISPFCEGPDRIVIAGSIRRQRPLCNDVDIVCIPKTEVQRDLLGNVTGEINLLFRFLQDYVKDHSEARFISGGTQVGKQVLLQLPKCQLDLWFATRQTWATRVLCRTGSREHNIWLCNEARKRGMTWDPYWGLKVGDRVLELESEEEMYRALGLPYLPPEKRERGTVVPYRSAVPAAAPREVMSAMQPRAEAR